VVRCLFIELSETKTFLMKLNRVTDRTVCFQSRKITFIWLKIQ